MELVTKTGVMYKLYNVIYLCIEFFFLHHAGKCFTGFPAPVPAEVLPGRWSDHGQRTRDALSTQHNDKGKGRLES